MKPNPKKLSFSTLAILFAVHVGMCLFAGVLFANALTLPVLAVALALFVISHFVPVQQGAFNALLITDTTYAGEFYNIFLMKLLTGFESAQKGLIKVLPGIKKEATLPTLSVDAFIQAAQDPPVFGGDATVGGRKITPQEVMGYMTHDPARFESHWMALQMKPELLDRDLPLVFESAVIDRTIQLTQNWMERIFWRGSFDSAAITTARASGLNAAANNLIFFDGIVKIAKAALAAGNRIVTPTAVVLTAGNVVSKFADLKNLIHASADGLAAYNDPNFVWIVNYKTGQLYGDAVKAQTTKGDDFTGKGKREYDGRRIVEVPGLNDDTIIGCIATNDERSNLWLGANADDEWTKFQVAKLQANSSLIFVKMLAKLGTQIAIPEQMFLYTTA